MAEGGVASNFGNTATQHGVEFSYARRRQQVKRQTSRLNPWQFPGASKSMLRVRIELVPDGDEALTTMVAELEIANDGSGTAFTGNYAATLREFSARPRGKSEIHETRAAIHDVERDLVRPAQLVGVALSVLAPMKRTMSSFPPAPSGETIRKLDQK